MKIKLHLEITDDSRVRQPIGLGPMDMEATRSIATLGLSLANGKAFLSQLQSQVVSAQIAAINAQRRIYPVCRSQRRIKDYHQVNFRSLLAKFVREFPVLICPTVSVGQRQKHPTGGNDGYQQNLSLCKATWPALCPLPDRPRFLACFFR